VSSSRQGSVEVRRNARSWPCPHSLFYLGCWVSSGRCARAFAVQVMSEEMVAQMEKSYADMGHGRDEGTDSMMASFYVYKQRGIAFRCLPPASCSASAVVVFSSTTDLPLAWWPAP